MREPTSAESVRALMREFGRVARTPARVYLVGGSTAVIEGWRLSTVDIDLKLEPDDELLRHLVALKERLNVNVELASPSDFLPELPGWRERSPFLFREGVIDVFHYDLYAQALSKLQRGFDQDLDDVAAMVAGGAVEPATLAELFAAIEPELYRFPAVVPADLRAAVEALLPGA
jgi:hypothetical protein